MLENKLPATTQTITAVDVFGLIGAAAAASKEVQDFLDRVTHGNDDPVARGIRDAMQAKSKSQETLESMLASAEARGDTALAEKIRAALSDIAGPATERAGDT